MEVNLWINDAYIPILKKVAEEQEERFDKFLEAIINEAGEALSKNQVLMRKRTRKELADDLNEFGKQIKDIVDGAISEANSIIWSES